MRTDHRSVGWVPCGGTTHQGSSPRLGAGVCIFWIYSRIYRCYALSGRRRSRDFVNFKICRLSPSEVLIGVGFAYVYS
jgi:hypothetical protein